MFDLDELQIVDAEVEAKAAPASVAATAATPEVVTPAAVEAKPYDEVIAKLNAAVEGLTPKAAVVVPEALKFTEMPEIDPIDLMANPSQVIANAVAAAMTRSAEVATATQAARQDATDQLKKSHADADAVYESPEFAEFLAETPSAKSLLSTAQTKMDAGLASLVLDLFKAKPKKVVEGADTTALTAMSTDGGLSSAVTSTQTFSRAEIQSWSAEKRNSMYDVLVTAYQEGRVNP